MVESKTSRKTNPGSGIYIYMIMISKIVFKENKDKEANQVLAFVSGELRSCCTGEHSCMKQCVLLRKHMDPCEEKMVSK